MTIYLAGKISGDPEYRAKFEDAAQMLRGMGFQVLNPAELPQGWTPRAYMRVCLPVLMAADCATFLPDWPDSRGARIERALAKYCGVPILEWDEDELGRVEAEELLDG